MPIKKENRKYYSSPQWRTLSRYVRFTRAKGRCEKCGAPEGQRNLFTGGAIELAAAHLNHTPGDDRKKNLKALCQACHLNYDRADNLRRARITRCRNKDAARPLFHFDERNS